jgi:hypothetical protein
MDKSRQIALVIIVLGLTIVAATIVSQHFNSDHVQPNIRHSRQSLSACSKHQPGWIVGAYTFTHFERYGASQALIDKAFNNDCTFVYNSTPTSVGIPTAYFQSYSAIRAAFTDGRLPGHFKAVMYDNEGWPYTPLNEKQDPAKYERLVARLLHRHGLLYIATPGASLTRFSGTLVNNNVQETYLVRDIAGITARYADVLDIQSQILQPNIGAFTSFVRTAARQARAVNPRIKIYIGIGTGPEGQFVTARDLYTAYQAVRGIADGYWLNLSSTSYYCPQCAVPQPQLAVDLLDRLYRSSSSQDPP